MSHAPAPAASLAPAAHLSAGARVLGRTPSRPGLTPRSARLEDVARGLVVAFNDRDPQAWSARFRADGQFVPTRLRGLQDRYRGVDELRRYIDELVAGGTIHRMRVRSVIALGRGSGVALADVIVGDDVVSPASTVLHVVDGKIAAARDYLSDLEALVTVGILPAHCTRT